MREYFEGYYYDEENCEFVSTREMFDNYLNDKEGHSTFPDYFEGKSVYFITASKECENICDGIEYYVSHSVENNIDEIRNLLDDLEEAIECREESTLRWEMVEVLE